MFLRPTINPRVTPNSINKLFSLDNYLEYIVNECNKHAEKFKRKTGSPLPTQKKPQNPPPAAEFKLEKAMETSPKKSEETMVEEKKVNSPKTEELAEPNTANILNRIMKTIDDEHGLDDHDIDQYINS